MRRALAFVSVMTLSLLSAGPVGAAGIPVPGVDRDNEHIRGDRGAPYSLVEYSDFECPFCQRHQGTMTEILEANMDTVNWVYRHFPLSFHVHAMPTAQLSECVADLGGNDAFWGFADIAFATLDLDTDTLIEEASEAFDLDAKKLKACVDAAADEEWITERMERVMELGINGTPTTVLVHNRTGRQYIIQGAVDASQIQKLIDEVLENEPEIFVENMLDRRERRRMARLEKWGLME